MIHRADTVMKRMPTLSAEAGIVASALFEHTFAAGQNVTGDDLLELGFLPAGTRPVRATLITEGFGAVSADIGLMSGHPGENVNPDRSARTVGDELFAAQSLADGEDDATLSTLMAIEPAVNHRSIGVDFSADVTGSGQTIRLWVEYVA